MKPFSKTLLLFSLLASFLNSTPAFATHLAGADLTYRHLSGNNYRVHLTIYRDCIGILPPGPIYVNLNSSLCSVSQLVTLDTLPGTGTEITLNCPTAQSTCQGGQSIGFQKWEYEGDVVIPSQCSDWTFSIWLSSRNNAITTLVNPGGDDIYLEARLNNTTGDNSSPRFVNDPFLLFCMNQDVNYNHGAFDEDGDSLAYSMVAPMTGPNDPVVYTPGYSVLNPFSNDTLSFNDFTGDFLTHPTAPEVPVIAFEVRDYRNGVLMGSVRRDLTLYISQCIGNYPTATHMNGTSQQFAYVFPDDTVCFDIYSDDPDAADTVTMTWNQTISAATFTTTTALHPTGTFCWIPDVSDVRSQPYMFTAMVQDNACPLNNAGVYSYFIYVTLDSSLVWATTNDLNIKYDISVSPNPSSGVFEIRSQEKIWEINVFDSFGKLILNTREIRIDISKQPEGIFFAEIKFEDGSMVRKKILKE